MFRLGVFVLSAAAVLGACGQQNLTVTEYADQMEMATDAYIAESQTLSQTFQDTVDVEVARIIERGSNDQINEVTDLTKREIVLYLALLEDAMSRYEIVLSDVDPPSDLTDAHSAYVDAFMSVRTALPETRRSIESAFHLDGIYGALAGSGFQDGQPRLTRTCQVLEQSVRSLGRGVDLGCARPSPVDAGR